MTDLAARARARGWPVEQASARAHAHILQVHMYVHVHSTCTGMYARSGEWYRHTGTSYIVRVHSTMYVSTVYEYEIATHTGIAIHVGSATRYLVHSGTMYKHGAAVQGIHTCSTSYIVHRTSTMYIYVLCTCLS